MTDVRKIVLTLLLLTFFGQSIAAPLDHCRFGTTPVSSAHEQMIDMTDHSGHDQLQADTDSAAGDCNMQQCQCSLGGCYFATLSTPALSDTTALSTPDKFYRNAYADRPAYSLFRPPISG